MRRAAGGPFGKHFLVACAFVFAAAATRSGHPTFDAWAYTMHVESAVRLGGSLATPELWHPHHLVYEPFGVLLVRAVRIVAPAAPALTVLQLLSALAGGIALFAFGRLVTRESGTKGPASRARSDLVPALLLATSFGFWYYAGEAEVYVPALACALAACAVLSTPHGLGWKRLALSALLLALAALFHQMIVLLGPAVLVWLWRRREPRAAVLVVAAWGALVLVVYALAWGLAARHGTEGPAGFWSWVTYYAHAPVRASQGWGQPGITAPLGALVGLVRALFGGHVAVAADPRVAPLLRQLFPGANLLQEFEVTSGMPRVLAWGVVALAAAAGVGWLRLLFGALRGATPDAEPDPRILFALWALVVAGFTAWWEADNLEFWLVALPGILGWILLRQRHPFRGRRAWGLLVLFALANFAGSIAPKRWGPGHEELALFARAASLPRAPGEGRAWPGFGDPYVPGQVLAPLWIRSRAPQEDLSADLASSTRRIWILPDTESFVGRRLDSCPGWQVRLLGE